MSVLSILYVLLIGPLEHLFELVFSISNYIFDNLGLSIIVLSLVVNFLSLPLYKRADEMQMEERDCEAKIRPWINHIKRHFKGTERFMMLQTLYRQNHYKPTDTLKGATSLLLEIPFFIAAYHFLSHLQQLAYVSFGPFMDLQAPDQMLMISDTYINFFPILMTVINIVSCFVYLKGMPLKSKIQSYGMAIVFLVLLYDSPSGLVFYWTLNNLFSLCKNIWYRVKPNRFVMPAAVSLLGVLVCVMMFTIVTTTPKVKIFFVILALLAQFPLVYQKNKGRFATKIHFPARNDKVFNLGCLFMILLTGVFIPVNVIQSSPEEFINHGVLNDPLAYVFFTALLAVGTFGVWFKVFYKLTAEKFQGLAAYGIWIVSGIAFCDYMLVGGDYGLLSVDLTFEEPLFSLRAQIINLLVIGVVLSVLLLILKYRRKLIVPVYWVFSSALVVLSLFYMVKIEKISRPARARLAEMQKREQPEIPLSRTGKNIVVLMLDRAINAYIPFFFHERPELKRQFEGFTYFPNTLSYGIATNIGGPPLFGGYEYVPTEMNKRSSEKLVDKHNEALKVMPAIFSANDFLVSICNPPYAGYKVLPDLTVFDEFPKIKKYVSYGSMQMLPPRIAKKSFLLLKNKFFRYSLFRIAPVCFQRRLYAEGTYNCFSDFGSQIINYMKPGLYKADGTPTVFLNQYVFLEKLADITKIIQEPGKNTFSAIDNDTTHAPTLLQLPDYIPQEHVNNLPYFHLYEHGLTLSGRILHMETIRQVYHYHANMAAMIQLGKWFDYLRSQDLYDNTRIILVSDHGYFLHQLDDMRFGKHTLEDAMALNPLLMVKDFGSRTFATDRSFMTNGDVPTLAFRGVIANPVNPYTGKAITDEAKHAGPQQVLVGSSANVQENSGNTFLPGNWYEIKNNIFDMSQWKKIAPPVK